jgi:hypothetical protein
MQINFFNKYLIKIVDSDSYVSINGLITKDISQAIRLPINLADLLVQKLNENCCKLGYSWRYELEI